MQPSRTLRPSRAGLGVRPPARLALLGALTLLAAACGGEPPGIARVLLAADLEAVTDQGWASVGPGEHLSDGADLRTGEEEARLQFRDGQVWLGPGTRATLRPDGVALRAGDLVVASDGALTARWDGVEVAGDGVFRLTSGVAPRLAVYAGEVTLVRPGERRTYPPLREVGLASARLAGIGDPLRYRASDPWDRRLLPAALTFDAEVGRVASELDRAYGTAPQPEDFYRSLPAVADALVPLLRANAPRTRDDGAFGPPAEALVTVFVAQAVVARHALPLEETVRQVADLRAHGAQWGVVAADFGIHTPDLAAALDLRRAPGSATADGKP